MIWKAATKEEATNTLSAISKKGYEVLYQRDRKITDVKKRRSRRTGAKRKRLDIISK